MDNLFALRAVKRSNQKIIEKMPMGNKFTSTREIFRQKILQSQAETRISIYISTIFCMTQTQGSGYRSARYDLNWNRFWTGRKVVPRESEHTITLLPTADLASQVFSKHDVDKLTEAASPNEKAIQEWIRGKTAEGHRCLYQKISSGRINRWRVRSQGVLRRWKPEWRINDFEGRT